ncbi:LysR substrate-binding domain-containing protein [Limibacillus halophilus]|uniref:LysR family glycine cleavage system transcriptional activator n=1 Tax=Limibacillus halophilus TaxID=1579333 RepID=A0A839SNJ8_9PROT|nr:LysR substrate-binding domain-containing protein [Limibacillus halophilus]MBB3063748.1 LysR family glycine cleavage system transcriptional activator [Limibacillus halophilus]
MVRAIPPLGTIRYFELAAEHESFVQAANDLRVSKGAVSQQIKQLEQFLGVSLFRRSGRRVVLTAAGRRYHSAVRNALNILEKETERVAGSRVRGQLKITVLPAFASIWLVPRMPGFQQSMPHIDIVVSADAEMVDFSRSDAQLGIRYGTTDTEGLTATYLGHDTLAPVCTPNYAEKMAIHRAEDLSRCLLLHDTYWSDDWTRWLTTAGVAGSLGGDGQFFTHYSMAIDTARAGGGIAMGHKLLLRDLFARNELVCPLEQTIAAQQGYFVVVPDKSAHLDYVKRFRSWLTASFGNVCAPGP